MVTTTAYSIAILAGGQSKRMGTNKALLPLQQKPVLQWVIDAVEKLSDDLFLVTNTPELYAAFDIRPVPDIFVDHATLGGLHAALGHARYEWVFVVACDMPLIAPEPITLLQQYWPDHDVVVPVVGDYPEPLYAFYRRTCRPRIEAQLRRKVLKVSTFYQHVRCQYVPQHVFSQACPNLDCLTNLNTPEDLQHLRRQLAARS